MKTLYLECNMGASGDMLMSALYELLPDKKTFIETMNGLDGRIRVTAEKAVSCGVTGTHINVSVNGHEEEAAEISSGHECHHGHGHEHTHCDGHEHGHEHRHSSLRDIKDIIGSFDIPDRVKADAMTVYKAIANAESKVHGVPVSEIHFHEVGTLDAVADITGVCLAMHTLAPDTVKASPVRLGSGQIHCAHGILPVPAPATAELLNGLPCYDGEIPGELCTPTGAALLSHFAAEFCPMPAMVLSGIGYGMGKKEFPAANCLRAFIGETYSGSNSEVAELCCNIDDMTAEALAFAEERMMNIGALDVSATPTIMKKGRPGTILTVMCAAKDESRLAAAMLRETTTNGVRVRRCARYILTPSVGEVETVYGNVRVKYAEGYGVSRAKPEYDSVAEVAANSSRPFGEVWNETMSEIYKDRKGK